MSLTEALLRPLSQVKPLITHYDDAAGTRQELSVATAANWAAKTANWLVEEHDVEPGTRLAVKLPPHWQTAGILLGAWWAGAHVVAEPEDALLTFVAPGATAPGLVAAVSLDPMGRDLGGTKNGIVDFVGESRLFGDDFFGTPVSGDTLALGDLTVDEALAQAKGMAEPNARVLSTIDWSIPDGVLRALIAPLAAGGSLVQVTSVDHTKLDAKRTSERTTTDLF
ncbi:TIGR03089 family protein [Actinokineospora sp. G85]|uniref:TIGR03089 family protein n=1 Tax=Actinokineospora sp. G85 TaxID=3406626 RepID=UPI003C70EA55